VTRAISASASASARARACACACWALATASGAGALFGLAHHALLLAVGFRALTAWRLGVAGRLVWRGDATRPWTVRFAALGSAAAHVAVAAAAVGGTLSMPAVRHLCASAARCSPAPWIMLPLAVLGLTHALWLWRSASY
jgi:hypothetical protein